MKIENIKKKYIHNNKLSTINSKGNFSEYSQQKNNKDRDDLFNMSKKINSIGEKILSTRNYLDVIYYKDLIRTYLKQSLDLLYRINKDNSFWQKKYFVLVDTIDKDLKDLLDNFVENEKFNLTIANSIEEINGLIIDSYK